MIRCQPNKTRDHVKVTFALPADNGTSGPVSVVGEFNQWDPYATPLRKRGNELAASLTLDAGGRYAFRYLADGGQWFDDDDADAYEENGLGVRNCILDLSQPR